MTVTLHHGDMLEVLPRLKAEGVVVQSVVTDAPYHLTSIVKRYGGESAAATNAGSAPNHTGAYARAARGFMGKQWDGGDIAFRAETWRLCWELLPPGGTVLDPFAGSGTTGMACLAEGFNAILVEREAEYAADIRRRLAHVRGEDTPLFAGAATP